MQTSTLKNIIEDKIENSRVRILVVDDDLDITLTFREVLKKNGFVVTVFNDPLKALSQFTAGLYDFVLLDIRIWYSFITFSFVKAYHLISINTLWSIRLHLTVLERVLQDVGGEEIGSREATSGIAIELAAGQAKS